MELYISADLKFILSIIHCGKYRKAMVFFLVNFNLRIVYTLRILAGFSFVVFAANRSRNGIRKVTNC